MKITIIENPRPLSLEHYNDVANAPLSASLNSGYASAIAKESGWDMCYLDYSNSKKNTQQIISEINNVKSNLILFHWVYSWGNEKLTYDIISKIKTMSNTQIGTFGLFPTMAYDKLSKQCKELDFIIVGEFEDILKELLNSIKHNKSLLNISGVYKKDFGLKKRDNVSNINTLPIPEDLGTNCLYNTLNISTSRGCFGDCSFCFINSYYGCKGRKERSINSIIKELDHRRKSRKIDRVYFIDPTFIGYGPQKRKRVTELSYHLKERNLPFGFETRVDTIDRETISTLAKNGAESIFLGIESGCDSILKRMNKRISTNDIKEAVEIIRDTDIKLSVGFIMFEPDSTLEELRQNFNFLEELGLLNFHDQTVNMLYHNQIVLYGSNSWNTFKATNRLILDPQLPFEARYKFKDPNVAKVCSSMRRLSSEYFINIDRHWSILGIEQKEQFEKCHERTPDILNENAINQYLKNAFIESLNNIVKLDSTNYHHLENEMVKNLASLFN